MAERALVIGASSATGGWLIPELLDAGIDTWATVRDIQAGGGWQQFRDRLQIRAADITDPAALQRLLHECQPTQIYCLAAIASIPQASKDPLLTYRINVMGCVNLLEAVRQTGSRARILLPGSCAQYGLTAQTVNPLTEEASFRPETTYAASKCALDLIAAQYGREFNLPILRTRTFYLAGPGQSEAFACASFAKQVARAEAGRQAVIRHGNLEAERDYLDMRDAVRAYRLLLEKGRPGEAYNLCSGRGISMRWALEQLLALATKPIQTAVEAARMRPAEIAAIVGSPAKLQADTGWQPRFRLEQTLADMLACARAEVRREG